MNGERLSFLLEDGVFKPTGTSETLITAVQECLRTEKVRF